MRTGNQTFKVVMLPTQKANPECLLLTGSNGVLHLSNQKYADFTNRPEADGSIKPQHLCIISNDRPKDGDWQYDSHYKRVEQYFIGGTTGMSIYKIIASTDKYITPNSWIPESFVMAYIKAHNEGKPITEVGLEVRSRPARLATGEEVLGAEYQEGAPITRPDRSVVIHQSKSYTKEQMMNAIAFGRNLGMAHPEVNEEQAKIRNEAIQAFVDSDFKF